MPGTGNMEAILRIQIFNVGQRLARDDMHALHVKRLSARSVTTARKNCLCPLLPQDKAWTCIPSVHKMLGSSPGFLLADWGMEQLSCFYWKSPCLHAMVIWSQPNLVSLGADFWQNSHCWTPALTEVNGYHLATLGSIGLIFLAPILFLLLARENSAFCPLSCYPRA